MRSVACRQPAEKPRAGKKHCSFYPLPHLLLPRSWPACCLSPPVSTYVCCQIVFLCQFLWLAPGGFPKVNAELEKPLAASLLGLNPRIEKLKNTLQLPPLATAAFATFLACLLPKCLLGLKLSFFSGSESDVRQCGPWPGPLQLPILASTQGLKNPLAASILGHSCFCHVPGLPVA